MRANPVVVAALLAGCATADRPADSEAPSRPLARAETPAVAVEPEPAAPRPPDPTPEPQPVTVPAEGTAPPPPEPEDDPVERAIVVFKEYLKTNPDSQGIRNQVAELALLKSEKVVEPLMGLLKSSKDDEVKIAVLQAVGKQGVKSVGARLMAMADSKPFDDKPKLIAAALEGAGDADAAGQYKELLKFAKKYYDRDADITCSALRAASHHVTRETVDDFIQALKRASYVKEGEDPRKMAARAAAKPVLTELLKRMTGKSIDDPKGWTVWWSDNKKTWKPAVVPADPPRESVGPDSVTDVALGFEIRRPSSAWSLRQHRRDSLCVSLEAIRDGERAAWVEMYAVGTAYFKEKTPTDWAEMVRGRLAGAFEPTGTPEWGKPCTFSGVAGVEQALDGVHRTHGSIRMRNVFLEKDGVMYYMLCIWRNGAREGLEADVAAILESFRFTK